MLSLPWLICLIALALIAFYWRDSLRAKELAYTAARHRCQEMQVQFLDDTVYLRRLWIKRSPSGALAFWRAFYFEFTVSGSDRYQGRVLTLGNFVEAIQLEPHRLQ